LLEGGILSRDAADRAEVNAIALAILGDGNAGHEPPAFKRGCVEQTSPLIARRMRAAKLAVKRDAVA
jgi:hypothetical protein